MLKKATLICLAAGISWGGFSAMNDAWERSDKIQGQAPTPIVQQAPTTTTTVPCMEDDPCWDCATMGNRICGPVHLHIYPTGAWCVYAQDEPIACGPADEVFD